MNVLGLHFGRDAGAAVVRDGRVICHIARDRHVRVEHAMTLDLATIERALQTAKINAVDLDFCAITSTQHVELIIDQPNRLAIKLSRHPNDTISSTLERVISQRGASLEKMLKGTLLATVYDESGESSTRQKDYRRFLPEHRTKPRTAFHATGWLEDYVSVVGWDRKATLEQISATNAAAVATSPELRQGFHLPVTVELEGVHIPAAFVHHQLCHAASSFFRSGLSRALVMTHDSFSSSSTYQSGMFYYGDGQHLTPFSPHHLAIGALYENVAHMLGLTDGDPAIDLMSLASQGHPRLFDRRFVGNLHDVGARFNGPYAGAWFDLCRERARAQGYDLGPARVKERAIEPINADIAASTQKLFEETMLAAVEALWGLARSSGIATDSLCLGGSAALNAASNSRIARESPFTRISVSAGCDDSGLAIGAALAAYHNVLDQPRPAMDQHELNSAYLGMTYDDKEIGPALKDRDRTISIQATSSAPESAARDLAAGKIVGWFEGRSEIGPFALGHRAILGDPRHESTVEQINRIAGRASWQKLGAAVLETEVNDWFGAGPSVASAGLFSGYVRGAAMSTLGLGQVRIQTVAPEAGDFYHLLRAFHVLTQTPLVINAPLKPAGEPLIETPDEAVRFFAASELDALYIDGYRISRRAEAMTVSKAPAKKPGRSTTPNKTVRTAGRAKARSGRRAAK